MTAILVIFGPLVFLMLCTIAQSTKRAADAAESTEERDPRGPRSKAEMIGRHPMFRDHNCVRCKDGTRPCVCDNPRRCEFPHARNDR